MRGSKFAGHALALLLLSAGCHKIFGEFTALSDEVNVELLCSAGEYRCLGAELQACNGTRDGWRTLTTCASPAHCSTADETCRDNPCTPGELQCNSNLLESCRDDQTGWDLQQECGSASLCDAAAGVCEGGCTSGEFRCRGAELQTCVDELAGWSTIKRCHSAALCDPAGGCGAEACTVPGAFRCDPTGVLERCADDLTAWEFHATCESVAHCDTVGGSCMTEPCTPGQYQCSGPVLEKCNTDSTGWDAVTTCETDALCQLTLGKNAVECEPPVCEAGAVTCDAGQPLVCNAGRTEYRENGAACLTAELCDSEQGTCKPPACGAGETRCDGAQPEICNFGRTDFVANGAPCENATLCNATTGSCGDARCVAGQWRCNPDNPSQLQRCKSDLTGWDLCDTCATAGLCSASQASATSCDADACEEPTCNLGDRWCGGTQGKTLVQCPASQINRQPDTIQECATLELCQLTREQDEPMCIPPSCALSDRWCGGSDGNILVQCPPSRINSQAMTLEECATKELCDLSHAQGMAECVDPSCDLGDRWCGGSGNATLYECPASRINSSPDEVAKCATSQLCDRAYAQGQDTCTPACAAGEKRCSGGTLQICNPGRTGWNDLETCGSATLCMNSLMPASQTTCDACVDASLGCNGDQPQLCSDPGDGPAVWEDSGDACDSADLCDAATGTCICSEGDTRCHPMTDNFEECQSTGWVETDTCAMGCDDVSGCL